MLVTNPDRTIVDSLEAGTQLEQIELAVCQALERGLTTTRRLRAAAAGRPIRVRAFVDRLLAESRTPRDRPEYGPAVPRRPKDEI